ncbi:AMP-binding protein [Salinactinospora qingdaonensis]|uniref:AMP-binding protein n=1 Tax=Salinactinospora qingdaonensis TaxID=702744 RepID=A0ABP7EZP9_9ACTN
MGTVFDRVAARHPSNVVILDHDLDVAPERNRRLTAAEVADLVADLASRLWAAKVRPGERVVVYKSDGFDISLLACAVARIGAVPVMLSPKLDGESVTELLRRATPAYFLTDQAKLDNELTDTVFQIAEKVLLASGDHPDALPMHALAGAQRVDPITMPANHPTLVTHTSGTTGLPKLAVHTGYSLMARYRPQASAVALVRKRETVAMHVSFVHSRVVSAMTIALSRGFPLLVLRDSDPENVAELFARFRPGIIEAHPNSFMEWEQLTEDSRRPLAHVKYFSSTFDAIHPRTVHRLLHASNRQMPLFAQLYGQSETGPIVASSFTRSQLPESNGRRVGVPFPGMTDVRVVSRNGAPPSESNPGYIEVRSDGRAITFLGEPERYAKQVTEDGWWRMGDVGYRDRWGRLYLLDREVDVIEGFGSTLATEDTLLARLPELTEVIIVRGADGTPVPVVSTHDDTPLDTTAWQRATRELPPMAEPVQWRIDDLPHTATTKIKRLELARVLAENGHGTAGHALRSQS